MTHRYYYDDPLAAAWMAKHFGMKIGVPDCSQEDNYGSLVFTSVPFTIHSWWDYNFDGCGAIHSDSEPILTPQVGDMDESGIIWDNDSGRFGLYNHIGEYCGDMGKIIQRNGIHFHWPKKEK